MVATVPVGRGHRSSDHRRRLFLREQLMRLSARIARGQDRLPPSTKERITMCGSDHIAQGSTGTAWLPVVVTLVADVSDTLKPCV